MRRRPRTHPGRTLPQICAFRDWHDAPVPGDRQTPPMTRAWQVAVLRAHLAHRTAEVEEARDELMAARQRVAELEAAPAARSPQDRRSLLRRLRWR